MTRAAQVTQAVSAMRKARAAPSSLPEPDSMAFLIYEDNAGDYHWTIVVEGGETLARSASFGSYEDAKQAAGIVHRGAHRASFEQESDNLTSVDLPAGRNAAPDRSDAERWLDEGGSLSNHAVAR
jgi:uncharacterized protein YegP (UPF0339 family)